LNRWRTAALRIDGWRKAGSWLIIASPYAFKAIRMYNALASRGNDWPANFLVCDSAKKETGLGPV
jgi:uncharacterized protein (DUF2252 family)